MYSLMCIVEDFPVCFGISTKILLDLCGFTWVFLVLSKMKPDLRRSIEIKLGG